MEISSKYSPAEVEGKWYQYWLDNKLFSSKPDGREPYTVVIPPPNVTGVLHMGHVLNETIQDILVRHARMEGKNACWVPGTDHASIATEAKVVNRLAEQGIKKSDLTREEFLKHAWAWTEEHGGIILKQLRKLGCSCDWDRTGFTMDEIRSESVIKVFVDLYRKGLIYRGVRMVNWDPKALTALSDEAVVYKEEHTKIYYMKYYRADSVPGDFVAEEGNIVADAIITNIQAKSNTQTWKDTKGKIQTSTYYTGIAEAMLTLKDAKTGEVITNTSFKGQGTTVSSFSTSDQAIRDALGKLSNRISAWLNKYKPLQANIIEGSSAKKDKQKEVYIDLGNSEGAFAGLHMGVFIVKTVAGREAKSQIGKLKIEAVEGDEISLCKVQSGGKDIKAAIEAGQQLQVISIDK